MTLKLGELWQKMANLESHPPSLESSFAPPCIPSPPLNPHRLKLEVLHFDGVDPLEWIFKITQFFEYYSTPKLERLTNASFYMDGPALVRFRWMSWNGQLVSWSGFLQALETRFAPSQYEDLTGALFKLTQKGSIVDYLFEFEALVNRIVGLPFPFLLSCLISGLSSIVRWEVQALQPLSLIQVVGLSSLQEEKFCDLHRLLRCKTNSFNPQPPSSLHFPTYPRLLPPISLSSPATKNSPPPSLKWLSPEELANHREKGLCFNRDEKYHCGHKCASKVFFLIAEEDDEAQMDPSLVDLQPKPLDEVGFPQAQISLHTLSGHLAPETLRLVGQIAQWEVVILVDGGSTHNFVRALDLHSRPTTPLRVMVGNGHEIECSYLCE